jgi:hypothetical protein
MIDTRLIYQVVEWDRRIEMENEKQKNLRPKPNADFTTVHEPGQKQQPSILVRIFRQCIGQKIAAHSAEPAETPDNPVYSES